MFILIIIFNSNLGHSQDHIGFKTFNEGVSFSLEASKALIEGDLEKSNEFNQKAIAKFLETLEADPEHLLAPSALGHSYYLIRDFQKGIEWYEKAIVIDSSMAVNHLEYGLCKINKGDIEGGKKSIDQALSLDQSQEIREQAVFELMNIGLLAFDYGNGYEAQGEKEKGTNYKRFSVSVMMLAHEINPENLKIIEYIVDHTEKMGDSDTANFFRKKLKE